MSIFNDKALKGVAEAVSKIVEAEKMATKDHDKDGKIETGKAEYLGSRIRAAKLAGNLKEDDVGYQDRYSVKNGKATVHNPAKGEKDEPHHVWADNADHAVRKHAAKTNAPMKESLDEAFPTVADGEKSLRAKEGKTSSGTVTKTKTGLVHKRDYKDDDNDADDTQKKSKGYGARQNFKRSTRVNEQLSFTEMLHLYNESGIEVISKIAPQTVKFGDTEVELIDANEVNGAVAITVAEEVDNETFTKEVEAQKAKNAGGGKKAEVAKASVQAVKQEEYEQIDEISKSTLGSYIKKASHDVAAKGAFTRHFADKSRAETAEQKHDIARKTMKKADKMQDAGMKRRANMAKAVDRLTKEDVQIDERTLTPAETKEKEKNVKGMKKSVSGFKARYGDRAKEVMYATATKMAKKD